MNRLHQVGSLALAIHHHRQYNRARLVVFPSSSSLNGHPGRPGKRAAGGRGRPGARGPGRGPTVVWAQPGCLGAFSSERLPTFSRLIAHNCSNNRPRTSLCAPLACLLHRRPPPKGRASRAARAAERPAAPVRLGRGGEPPGLISPSGVPSLPEFDKLQLWTDMSNPDDDTNVPSGLNDDAEMERTQTPPRQTEARLPSALKSAGLSAP